MNLNKPYPTEKRAVILNQSDDELWAFFQEILNSKKKNLTKILPKPTKGFRRNSPEGQRQRFGMLIQYARGSETAIDTEKAWNGFSLIWLAWIQSHQPLKTLLAHYDNSADFEENGKVKFPNINTSLDIGCFAYLAKANQSQLSGSLIQRFYEFGYFQPDSTIEFIIQTIQKSLEKPNDMTEKIELEQCKKICQDIQIRVNQIETQYVREHKKEWVELKKVLDNVLIRVSTLEKNNHKLQQLENLSQTVHAINHQLQRTANTSELEKLNQQIGRLEKTLNDEMSPTIEFINQQLANLSLKTEVDELKQQLSKLQTELNEQEELFFDELEKHHIASPTHDSAEDQIQPTTGLYTTELQGSDSPRILSSKDELVCHLTDNLKAIGLIKGAAEAFAQEILAGLSAGEVIVFSGSFAFYLAEVCTQALAASASQPPVVIHIPIGLLNGQPFGDCLLTAIQNANQSEQMCAVIIEGLNRSALETYAQALRQMIIKRLLEQPDSAPNLLFFGTLVDGLSTLPVPLELSELGPIFDTDVLGWRSQFKNQASIAGAIDCSVWQTDLAENENQNGSVDLTEISNDFAFYHNSQLWQLCVKHAGRYLDNDLQRLAFGWLVPRAMSAELEWTKMKEWLLDDLFQQEKDGISDKRLNKLLRNHLTDD
jgi:hypothetical protein